MKILFFSPAPTKKEPTLCPFIYQRILGLKKHNIDVVVLQYGNIYIHEMNKKKKKNFILRSFFSLFHFIKNAFQIRILHTYGDSNGFYKYYNHLHFYTYNEFKRWFCKQGFDFIHGHFLWFSELLPTIKLNCEIPYIVTCHGSDVHETPFLDLKKQSIYKNILLNADWTIFVSEFLKNRSTEFGYDSENFSIIYNGFNKNIFNTTGVHKNKDKYIIGFVGHTIPVKRAGILPDIFKIIKEKLPNSFFYLIGSDNSNNDLTDIIIDKINRFNLQDSFFLLGSQPQNEVAKYMKTMNVLVLPSINEGFSCVIIEAQACGVGAVTSCNGGIPEGVSDCGICVPESDNFIEDFAESVIKYLKNPTKIQKLIEHSKSFTWEKCISQEIDVYNKISAKQ